MGEKTPGADVGVGVEVKKPSVDVDAIVDIKKPSADVGVGVEEKTPSADVGVVAGEKTPSADVGVGVGVEEKTPSADVKTPSADVGVGVGVEEKTPSATDGGPGKQGHRPTDESVDNSDSATPGEDEVDDAPTAGTPSWFRNRAANAWRVIYEHIKGAEDSDRGLGDRIRREKEGKITDKIVKQTKEDTKSLWV